MLANTPLQPTSGSGSAFSTLGLWSMAAPAAER
jgi:hypothetical protein